MLKAQGKETEQKMRQLPIIEMATSEVSESVPSTVFEQTGYQIFYRYQPSIFFSNVRDFTAKKLHAYADSTSNPVTRLNRYALLKDYLDGNVAVCWCNGEPKFQRLERAA